MKNNMNVIIEVQSGSSKFVRRGWGNVLASAGFNVVYHDIESGISINDIFDRLGDVRLFLGTTYNLNRALIRQILKRKEMKVALYGSAFGKFVETLDLEKYPVQIITTEEHRNFDYIKDRVDCVHIHIQDDLVEGYIGDWTTAFGVKTIGIMNAADTFIYSGSVPKEKYAADVAFVGGLWPYKARNLDKTMVRLCRERWGDLNIKVFGAGWDVPQALGNLPLGEDGHVFASAKICPNISEPHSTETKINDIVERVFKVPASGGFLICDDIKLPEDFVGIVPQFSSYECLTHLIDYYLKPENQLLRLGLINRQKAAVLANHTYFDRMAKLLDSIGMTNESQLIKQKKVELCSKN